MRSRITGNLQTYVLTEQLATCQRFDIDMNVLKTSIQTEFDNQSIDAQIEECKQIRGSVYDYLITTTWAPASSPVLPALVVLLVKALIVVATFAAIVIIAYQGAIGFKEILAPTPKYYCSICGAGPFDTVAELIAHRAQYHPDAAKYQCPYCGQAFNTPEELNAHVAECPWKPQAIPDWVPWVIVGIVAVGAIIIIPKVLGFIKTKGE